MKIHTEVYCDEAKIQRTIEASKAAFFAAEEKQSLSPMEFLYQQSRYIKKCWWLLQGLLLGAVCLLLLGSDSPGFTRRSLGVAAPLFVILLLPELWKNRSSEAMEVEGTTYYTIRRSMPQGLHCLPGWICSCSQPSFWEPPSLPG